jgi:glycosyltransferase involved in cell wall biosynthesis
MSRIALFHPEFGATGGAESVLLEEASCLESGGEEVTVCTMRFDEGRWGARLDGLPLRILPPFERRFTDVFLAANAMGRRRVRARRVTRDLAGFDRVVAHNYPCNALLGVSGLGAPKIWRCHEPPRFLHPRGANPFFTAWVESRAADEVDEKAVFFREKLIAHRPAHAKVRFDVEGVAGVDRIVPNSAFTRDNAERIYGRRGEDVVYPIVRFPTYRRPRAGLDRSGLGVLVQSRLEIVKNVDTVLRGFASFRAGCPGATLHVVGDGSARGFLEELAATLLPPGAAIFHGFLPARNLEAVCDRCDVFALLPLDEPFGLVFAEAAARGLLLIGPDHGGPVEILDGGRLGWCVDAFDPATLAAALREASSLSDADADRLRAKADGACRSRYARDVIAPQLARVLLASR